MKTQKETYIPKTTEIFSIHITIYILSTTPKEKKKKNCSKLKYKKNDSIHPHTTHIHTCIYILFVIVSIAVVILSLLSV